MEETTQSAPKTTQSEHKTKQSAEETTQSAEPSDDDEDNDNDGYNYQSHAIKGTEDCKGHHFFVSADMGTITCEDCASNMGDWYCGFFRFKYQGEGTDQLHCCCSSAKERARTKLEKLKLEKTELEKRKEQEVTALRQKSLEYERLLKASRDTEREAEKRWDAELRNVAEKIADEQEIWDEYRYFFVMFRPSECKLQDLPVFHKHKIIRSVVWKAIWHYYAIVELETPLTKPEYDVEDILTDEEIEARSPHYYIVESDSQEMQQELDFHTGKTKKTVYNLLCDEYADKDVNDAFAKVGKNLREMALWSWKNQEDYDPDDVCVICNDVLYDGRHEEWEDHIILENPRETFQFCEHCKHTIIQMFEEQGICIPEALLKVE